MKVVLDSENSKMEVWFVLILFIFFGFIIFGQLFGLILEVVMDEGCMIMIVEIVEIQEVDLVLLVVFIKGKKIIRKKY